MKFIERFIEVERKRVSVVLSCYSSRIRSFTVSNIVFVIVAIENRLSGIF